MYKRTPLLWGVWGGWGSGRQQHSHMSLAQIFSPFEATGPVLRVLRLAFIG